MYRDDLFAAQLRVSALEHELGRRADHESELNRLRLLLSRYRSDRMPRDMRLLQLGTVGALLGTGYLLLAMSLLPVLGSKLVYPLEVSVFLPWIGPAIFGAMLVGLRGLARESFDSTAPFWLVAAFFALALLTPLLPLKLEVIQVAEAFLWAGTQLLFGYVVVRSPRIPRPLAVSVALSCLASAVFSATAAINDIFWAPYVTPWTALYQQGAMKLLAAGLASSALSAFLVAAAFHLARAQLISRGWAEASEERSAHQEPVTRGLARPL